MIYEYIILLYMNFLILLLSSLISFSQTLSPEDRVKELEKKKELTIEDFEHENSGCPENSDCSKELGLLRKTWTELFKSFSTLPNSEIASKIENYREKNGILVDFYSQEKSKERFPAIIYESNCPKHNKKDSIKIVVGSTFIKDAVNSMAQVKINQKTEKIPIGDLLQLDPVFIIDENNIIKKYFIPRNEKPIYVEEDSIIILLDNDTIFYGLKINSKGEWKIISPDSSDLVKDAISDVPCPQNPKISEYLSSNEFKNTYQDHFCQSILDLKTKKKKTMLISWACQ